MSDPHPEARKNHLHLGCGDDRIESAWNVDKRPTDATDETHDLTEFPWPWPDDSAIRITMSHVLEHLPNTERTLRECARVLRPQGRLVVRWPMGLNEVADPDHQHQWVWDTPAMYCGKRPWDADVGLTVVDRSVELHTHLGGVVGACYYGVIQLLSRTQGDGWWQFDLPATSGEFTVTFEKPRGESP